MTEAGSMQRLARRVTGRGALGNRIVRRLRREASRVPAALAAILGVALVIGVTWALLVPPWQSPDEVAHFAYTQVLAERGELPPRPGRSETSSEQFLALFDTDQSGQAFKAYIPAIWNPAVARAWRRRQARLPASSRGDGGGPNPASSNPPLYYAYDAVPYLVFGGSDVIGRMYAMRAWSVLMLLVSVAATWLLAGELFRRDRLLQAAAAGVVALQPMTTFISAMTNPDSMLIALWSLALWLGVRVLRRGLDARSGVALGLVAGLGVLVKATSYALLPAVMLALAVGLWRRRGVPGNARVAVLCALALVVPIGGWIAGAHALDRPVVNQISASRGARFERPPANQVAAAGPVVAAARARSVNLFNMSYGDFARYLQRFYLPHGSPHAAASGPAEEVWIRGGWGLFGWTEFGLPSPVVTALRDLSLLALLGGAAFAVVRIRARRSAAWVLAFFALAGLALVGALHYVDFQTLETAKLAGTPSPGFLQGRYLLPVVALMACCATGALALFPRRARPVLVGVLLGGMSMLEVLSLGLVLARYYG